MLLGWQGACSTGRKTSMSTTISDYIERDLAVRIGASSGSAIPLTLHALSNHYGVSPTPVRAALRRLLAEGFLVRRRNGRIDVNPRSGILVPLTRTDLRETSCLPSGRTTLEAALTTEIIRKSLSGEANYLREEATAAWFGVGRTAIRQAFSRLAGRGLIVHVPRAAGESGL